MNEKLVAFICCVSDEKLFMECVKHIRSLYVPKEFQIEILPLFNSKDITISYNKAMKKSNAKYKVYIHQDSFIMNKNFIMDILKIFSKSEQIGMIGVAGVVQLPHTGVWWEGDVRFGKVIEYRQTFNYLTFQEVKELYVNVHSVDGLLLVTQHDIEWDEQIKGFHFYDTSQCIKFNKKGLSVVIPRQPMPWVLHFIRERQTNFAEFNQSRKKFLDLYLDDLKSG
ncbi:glycosyltransferase family protein [Chengkuizengella sp. SCS-71B]|uniref:glycosyltransferase family protein n=1 Tax=Chengkuizengella sp. SCS-71B TaxID=3115290 RepID=UPI0032C21E02